jgi:hypothetical protein
VERWGGAILISKVHAILGAALLVAATATISVIAVSKWNLFPPKDYEDCAARAAKDAKSKDGLSVLLSICSSDFKGRRKAGGGYTYYDTCQHRTVDTKGPNPTPDELKAIIKQCSAYLDAQARSAAEQEESERRAQQAAQVARDKREQAAQWERDRREQAAQMARDTREQAMQLKKYSAMKDIHVTVISFECSGYDEDICRHVSIIDMRVKATNGSKEAVSSVTIGLASVPTIDLPCPSTYAEKKKLDINLSPGETREKKIEHVDYAFKRNRVCIKVLDVQFAGGQ